MTGLRGLTSEMCLFKAMLFFLLGLVTGTVGLFCKLKQMGKMHYIRPYTRVNMVGQE